MYFLSPCFFLPIINALLTVEVHRNSFYRPFSPCSFIRNVSLSPDASIQSCIWECFYQHTCQTAIYYHNEKFCVTFVELCKTGTIQPSELVWTSVICSRKVPEPISTCPSTSTDHGRQQEETSNWDMITNTAAGTAAIPDTNSFKTVLNINLLANGDAETGPCETGENVTPPTGWDYNGSITQVSYNANYPGSLSYTDPGPNDRGRCYFFGQISNFTSMWQLINITSPVDYLLIDNQTVKFNFSAWLGGFAGQDDNAAVSLSFFNQSNQMLGNRTIIGPVLDNDRGGQTELVYRQAIGSVPVGTRFLFVLVEISLSAGTWNNGYVDNITVILYH